MIATSMATLCAGHGFKTLVISRSESSTKRCLDSFEANFAQMVAHALVTDVQIDACRSCLTISQDYASLSGAEAVFECIAENLDEKHNVYGLIEENCPDVRAICSVSSSIVPDKLADGMEKYGDRIVVTHPFNPAHMVPYFELCASSKTASGVIDYSMQLLKELDRKPVLLKKPTPGFIGNRLQFALLREALELVESGIADPKDVDTCLNYSFCPRYTSIGIFEHFDNGGLELCSTVCENLFPIISDKKTPSPILTDKIKEGNLGPKTGQGFYDWKNVDMALFRERINEPYWRFCKWDMPEE
jgi:3-hydroxybutyryl-CoA dehydrogenase